MEETAEFLKIVILIASFIFFSLIGFEIYYSRKHNLGLYSGKETLASLITGIVHRTITILIPMVYKLFFLQIGYQYAPIKYENGVIHFVVALLLTDCAYYWQHRINHKLNFFWAFHETHHSSQELNLMTAVRVSWIMPIFGAIFYTPIAFLGISPEYVIISLVFIFYGQWWCHTSLINKLPWIEGILNTPSAHRVHHSPNSKKCGSNFAGFFMFWDRIFGSYVPEQEKIVKFGINDGFVGHNPLVINFRGSFNYWSRILKGKKSILKKLFIYSITLIFIAILGTFCFFYFQGEKIGNKVEVLQSIKLDDSVVFDFDDYLDKYGGRDLRESKLNHVNELTFSAQKFNYVYSQESPMSWGALPHPLDKKSNVSLNKVDRRVLTNMQAQTNPFYNLGFQRLIDSQTSTTLTKNESIQIYENGESFQKYLELIQNSEKFVFLQMLAVSCRGDSVQKFWNLIHEKIEKGVSVYLLVDKLFSRLDPDCIADLEAQGVNVVAVPSARGLLKATQHSSYILNDKNQMLIGSQSIYWGFFDSNGVNFLDRDTMLYIKGPAVTDAAHEFSVLWNRYRFDQDFLGWFTPWYQETLVKEVAEKKRGENLYSKWIKDEEQKLCRFISQRPNREKIDLEKVLSLHVKNAQKNISLSSVKFFHDQTESERQFLALLKEKSHDLQLDFFANGIAGGNGELTIELVRLQAELLKKSSRSVFDNIKLGLFYNIEQSSYPKQAQINFSSYDNFKDTNAIFWLNGNFTHHKTWSFDNQVFGVTSALLAGRSFDNFYEAGVLCMDRNAQLQFEKGRAQDIVNSMPYWPSSSRFTK